MWPDLAADVAEKKKNRWDTKVKGVGKWAAPQFHFFSGGQLQNFPKITIARFNHQSFSTASQNFVLACVGLGVRALAPDAVGGPFTNMD